MIVTVSIIVVVVVAFAGLWMATLLLNVPVWAAAVATCVGAVGLICWWVFRRLRTPPDPRNLKSAIRSRTRCRAAAFESTALEQNFKRATHALKGHPSRANGRFHDLPWYLVLGGSGVGKTTAIRNSGLHFLGIEPTPAENSQPASTHQCEWWITNRGLLIDTSGRYATDSDDRDEWIAVLRLIRKYHPRQPLSGVVLALPVAAEDPPEILTAQAMALRQRLDEIERELDIAVPVYVVLTKSDLLPGFNAFFAELSAEERKQLWGFTLPLSTRANRSTVDSHFRELATTVQQRSIAALLEPEDSGRNAAIHRFPQHFRAACERFHHFFTALLVPNERSEVPRLRGVYLSSGTQNEPPFDAIRSHLDPILGLRPVCERISTPVPYFLNAVFRRVIFRDGCFAARSLGYRRKVAVLQHCLGLLALGGAITASLAAMRSFELNREQLRSAQKVVAAVEIHHRGQFSETFGAALMEMFAFRQRLDEERVNGVPIWRRFGMYRGDELLDPLTATFGKVLHDSLGSATFRTESVELDRFVRRHLDPTSIPDVRTHLEFKGRLRTYLLLSGPRSAAEPGLTSSEEEWLSVRLQRTWSESLRHGASQKYLRDGVHTYLSLLADGRLEPFGRNRALVAAVRSVLSRTSPSEIKLAEIVSAHPGSELMLQQLTNSTAALTSGGRGIRYAFTRPVWEREIGPVLAQTPLQLFDDLWVTERDSGSLEEAANDAKAKLVSAYFEAFIAEWREFLDAVDVRPAADYLSLQRLLDDLAHGSPAPIGRLAINVRYHTDLPPIGAAADGTAGVDYEEKTSARESSASGNRLVSRADLKSAFSGFCNFGSIDTAVGAKGSDAAVPPAASAPLDIFHDELRKVRDALRAKIDHDGASQTQALVRAVSQARNTVMILLGETDLHGWSGHFERLLTAPLDAAWSIAGDSASLDITRHWCADVVEPLQALQGRYPFARTGRELSLAAVTDFLHPRSGQLWAYYDGALASRITRKANHFEINPAGLANRTKLSGSVADFLTHAHTLARALFPAGANHPQVEFDVWIDDNPSAAETILLVDGLRVRHRNGPGRWQRVQWPGNDKEPGASLETRGFGVHAELTRAGNWGLFALLEAGTVDRGTDSDVFSVRWDLTDQGAGVVRIRIRPLEENNPFFVQGTPGFMQAFRAPALHPPALIVVDGPSC